MLQRQQFSEPHFFQLLCLHRLSKPGSLSSFISPPTSLQCSVLITLVCASFLAVASRTCAAIHSLPSCPKPVFPSLRPSPHSEAPTNLRSPVYPSLTCLYQATSASLSATFYYHFPSSRARCFSSTAPVNIVSLNAQLLCSWGPPYNYFW